MLDVVKLDGNILIFFVLQFFSACVCYLCHFNECLQAPVGT